MRTLMRVAIMAAGLSLGGAAQAQSWGVQFGYGRPTQADWQDWQGRRTVETVCSGQRAGMLEQRLHHEVDEGDIDPDTAGRIHEAIDRLEDRQHRECDEGDWRSIGRIAERYNGIEGWIDGEAHGSHWRAGW